MASSHLAHQCGEEQARPDGRDAEGCPAALEDTQNVQHGQAPLGFKKEQIIALSGDSASEEGSKHSLKSPRRVCFLTLASQHTYLALFLRHRLGLTVLRDPWLPLSPPHFLCRKALHLQKATKLRS